MKKKFSEKKKIHYSGCYPSRLHQGSSFLSVFFFYPAICIFSLLILCDILTLFHEKVIVISYATRKGTEVTINHNFNLIQRLYTYTTLPKHNFNLDLNKEILRMCTSWLKNPAVINVLQLTTTILTLTNVISFLFLKKTKHVWICFL